MEAVLTAAKRSYSQAHDQLYIAREVLSQQQAAVADLQFETRSYEEVIDALTAALTAKESNNE